MLVPSLKFCKPVIQHVAKLATAWFKRGSTPNDRCTQQNADDPQEKWVIVNQQPDLAQYLESKGYGAHIEEPTDFEQHANEGKSEAEHKRQTAEY